MLKHILLMETSLFHEMKKIRVPADFSCNATKVSLYAAEMTWKARNILKDQCNLFLLLTPKASIS